MFQMIHGYLPNTNYWDGLVKKGFIRDKSGIKLIQHALTGPEEMFNAAAKQGSKLYEIIRECARPFYVDRLQGGTYYYAYDYDLPLIYTYREMLGEHFLGFQMHEWASNYIQDWKRIEEVLNGKTDDVSEGILIQAIKAHYPYAHIMLESMSAREFAEQRKPDSIKKLEQSLRELFVKRYHQVSGCILPADSYLIGPQFEADQGVRKIMPEIGGQIRYTRVQLALARGIGKMRGISFGAYYEPWGGSPFSCCYYKNDSVNEWRITDGGDFPFQANGKNGGSSRLLQRRIFFYAYLSGAQFLSEEWGVCNTFYDWRDFEISPYGEITKEFLSFTDRCPDIGTPYTPFAVVLPKERDFFDLGWLGGQTDQYLSFPLEDRERRVVLKIVETLRTIYGDGQSAYPQEAGILTNSSYGDLFDIVYEEDAGIFERYEYCIDLTGKPDFQKQNQTHTNRIVCAESTQQLKAALNGLIEHLLPFQIKGPLHWMANKTNRGWILSFFHNDGVTRSVEEGEKADPLADAVMTITCKAAPKISVLYGSRLPEKAGKMITLPISAGNLAVLKLSFE